MLKLLTFICISSVVSSAYAYNKSIFSGTYHINNKEDLIVSGLEISNPSGDCFSIYKSKNIIINNSVIGPCKGLGITIDQSDNIKITGNIISNVNGGVYALDSQGINVINNHFFNIDKDLDSDSRGQYVQFDKISGNNNKINNNYGISILGTGNPIDLVNIFSSTGTISDPIQIIGNHFIGGGPDDSGGGILTGDSGGSNILVEDNILIDPGQYGIAIAGGTNISIKNNQIYAKEQYFTNVGIYVWNQSSGNCSNHTVSGNQVNWTNNLGKDNGSWDSGNCGSVMGWSENDWNADINEILLNYSHIIEKDDNYIYYLPLGLEETARKRYTLKVI